MYAGSKLIVFEIPAENLNVFIFVLIGTREPVGNRYTLTRLESDICGELTDLIDRVQDHRIMLLQLWLLKTAQQGFVISEQDQVLAHNILVKVAKSILNGQKFPFVCRVQLLTWT